jgi:predicted  nucleic acid-binding Zn-ribbon protein
LTTIEKLLVLQDRDRKIRSLTQETVDIPARKQLIDQRLRDHRAAVANAQEDLKKNASATKDVELEIESRKTKILKLRDQQGQIKTNQEYRAIENEVAALQVQIREIEEREIGLMEAAEAVRARLADAEHVLKREQAAVETDMKALDARMGNIQSEIDAVKADREKLLPDIDPEWLAKYQRIFANKGDLAMVPVESGSCGGCHMRLPPQQVHLARRGTELVPCSFCGRLLFTPAM